MEKHHKYGLGGVGIGGMTTVGVILSINSTLSHIAEKCGEVISIITAT